MRSVAPALGILLLLAAPADAYQIVQQQQQAEARDAAGRLTAEAATIHTVACNGANENRRQFLIYQYQRRAGFRAILPPYWTQPVGNRDFASFNEAVSAACLSGTQPQPPQPPPQPPRPPQPPPQPPATPGGIVPQDLETI